MNYSNTIQRGDAFEWRVYNLMKELLESGKLPSNPNTSKIFWKKSYFSAQRNSHIEFDIAIESYHEGSDQYSTLHLFECKDYSGSVPVGHVEAFDSKLNQVGEHNTKGYFFCTSSLQQSALDLAKAKKMGIAIISDENIFTWLNHRKERGILGNNLKLVTGQLNGSSNNPLPFFGYADGWSYESLPDMLIALGVIDHYTPNEKYLVVPFLSDIEIEKRINDLGIQMCYDNLKLDTDKLCELISILYDVNFIFDQSLNSNGITSILGKIIYDPLEIYITKDLPFDQDRFRFTLAHEIGHMVLHSSLMSPYFDLSMNEGPINKDRPFSYESRRRMEAQANVFASELLIPFSPLSILVQTFFAKERIFKGHMVLDHQSRNQIVAFSLLKEIATEFGVSIEAAKIRLIKLGLLKDKTDTSMASSLYKAGLRY